MFAAPQLSVIELVRVHAVPGDRYGLPRNTHRRRNDQRHRSKAARTDVTHAALASICARFPIHLLLMTPSEEAEGKFIQGQGAIEITPDVVK